MPAGVDWMPYLKFTVSALLSMFAGSQVVHLYYKPELEIPDYVPEVGELGRRRDEEKRRKADEREGKVPDGAHK